MKLLARVAALVLSIAMLLTGHPDVAIAGDMTEKVDDDYGMSEAIRRIREQPGGDSVPVAIVLTKCDKHGDLIKEAGGLRGFTDRYYHNILRACRGRHRRFSAAAVRVRRDARGHGAERDGPSSRQG